MSNRQPSPRLQVETLETREVPSATIQGPSSSQTSYLIPTAPGVEITSILTVGDSVNLKPDGTPYRAVGIMDGLGAYDNGNGTFTLLMNHELPANTGIARAHGNIGSFVSEWVINKSDLRVVSIRDFVGDTTSIFLSNNNPATGAAHTDYLAAATTIFSRLCSADLAEPGAYRWTDPATRITYGTDARIFQTGEESGGILATPGGPEARIDVGRQFAFVATDDSQIAGDQANTAYEMPHAGLFTWENNLANPLAQRKTIVAGTDDSTGGQVYFWVGEKQTTGNVVERAGLTRQSARDNLYVVRVDNLTPDTTGATNEVRDTPLSGTFSLQNEGDVSGLTLGGLESLSDSKGGTQFFRPEDGQWDPRNPRDFYFVTTDRYDEVKDNTDGNNPEADGTNDTVVDQVGRSRLYRLRFADIANPELGGTIEAVLDGTEAGNMFDNMTIDSKGRVLLQEDVGNQAHSSKIWLYDIATDELIEIAQHDPARFGDLVDSDNNPATPPVNVPATAPFTQDEESSGIIDVSHILGEGKFLTDVQAHYSLGGELVEGGQLLLLNLNAPTAKLTNGVLTVEGTVGNDAITVTKFGNTLVATAGLRVLGTFDARRVDTVVVDAANGNDLVFIAPNVGADAVVLAGSGNDVVFGGGGRNILVGGSGSDLLFGGSDSDILIGGNTTLTADQLVNDVLAVWVRNRPYAQRVAAVRAVLASTVSDDGAADGLFGLGGLDLFFVAPGDLDDKKPGEQIG